MSNTEIINLIAFFLIIVGLSFRFIYVQIFNADDLIPTLIFYVGFLIFFLNYFFQYKDFEKIDFNYNGDLVLDESSIMIHDKIIELLDITKFEIKINGYYGERINPMWRSYAARAPIVKNCLGVKNHIKITYNGQVKESFFELKSGTDQKNLELYLYKAIMSKNLINLPPKDSIKLIPKMYVSNKKSDRRSLSFAIFLRVLQIFFLVEPHVLHVKSILGFHIFLY